MMMTKDESKILDWRSTGRRKARRALYHAYVPYSCVDCGVTSLEPPKDAPAWFDELWPESQRVLDYQLQADHESKDFENNEVEYLNWRCQPCHKKADRQTGKGIPQKSLNVW
jgi:hypothetical protein